MKRAKWPAAMRILSLVALASALGTIAGACGDGVALFDTPEERARVSCEQALACHEYPDLDTCLATRASTPGSLDEIAIDVRAEVVDYDPDRFDDCLSAIVDFNDCRISFTTLGELTGPCRDFLEGLVARGDPCTEDLQCAGASRCDVPQCPASCCLGTCVAAPVRPIAELGEECLDLCVDGAFCDFREATPRCAALLEVGESCTTNAFCVDGALCDVNETIGSGTCIALAEPGDSCEPNTNRGISCVRRDNFCDPTDSVCKLRLDVGETCSPSVDSCRRYTICRNEVCAMRSARGESCSGGSASDCLPGLACFGGTCDTRGLFDFGYCPLQDGR